MAFFNASGASPNKNRYASHHQGHKLGHTHLWSNLVAPEVQILLAAAPKKTFSAAFVLTCSQYDVRRPLAPMLYQIGSPLRKT